MRNPLDNGEKTAIITYVAPHYSGELNCDFTTDLQRYRRGHNEHDWKSCSG